MAFEPFLYARDCALVRIGRWMRTVKDPNFAKQINADPRAFSFPHLGAKGNEKSLYVAPAYRSADWPSV
jgi:hypothetical protein